MSDMIKAERTITVQDATGTTLRFTVAEAEELHRMLGQELQPHTPVTSTSFSTAYSDNLLHHAPTFIAEETDTLVPKGNDGLIGVPLTGFLQAASVTFFVSRESVAELAKRVAVELKRP